MSDISQQLIEQVQAARADKKRLHICGRGTKEFMGRSTHGDKLDVSGHSGIVSYNPVELVLTARAGTPISEIEQALDEKNQMLSFEPPKFGGASIGGTLACNQSGPGRPWGGSVRDAVLGTRIINGKGEHLKFGGQVMKNVAGYDVSRLQSGALGTLGVITEISLKVLPKPAASITLMQDMDADEAILMMNQLAGKPNPLSAASWVDGKLYIRLSGAASAVDQAAGNIGGDALDAAEDFWERVREQQHVFFDGDEPLWRFSINSFSESLMDNANWFIDWGGSQRWLRGEYEKRELEKLAERSGGQVSLYRGGDRSGEVFHHLNDAMQRLQTNVKLAIDPDEIFNPGRLYSWM